MQDKTAPDGNELAVNPVLLVMDIRQSVDPSAGPLSVNPVKLVFQMTSLMSGTAVFLFKTAAMLSETTLQGDLWVS